VRFAYLATSYLAVPFFWSMAWVYAEQIAEDMTPETAGLRSPYYFMLTVDRMYMRENLYWLLGLFAVLIAGLFYWPKGWIPLALLQVYLFLGMTNFATTSIEERIGESSSPQKETEKSTGSAAQNVFSRLAQGKSGPETQSKLFLEQIAQLYRASGWEVEVRPRTQNPSIDPLLVDIDLLATREGRGVVVDIVSSVIEKPFTDFQRPAAIVQAVWSLAEARSLDPGGLGASLVLINRPAGDKIERICERLSINLIQLNNEDIDTFLSITAEDVEARSSMAESMLRLHDQAAV